MGTVSPRPTVYHHYLLIDPRVSDEVKRVRYVGRTIRPLNKRFGQHLAVARAGARTHRDNWLRQLLALGLEPILSDAGDGPEERETELIARWKARGADLVNRTDGGDGCKGYLWDDEQRARRSIVAQRVAATPGWKEKVAERTRAALSTPEMRAKISAGVRLHLEKPGAREKQREAAQRASARPEVKAKRYPVEKKPERVAHCRKFLHTAAVREKAKASHQATCANSEYRAQCSAIAREINARPGYQEKKAAGFSKTLRERREVDPENEQVIAMFTSGLSKAEIARRLGWAYKKAVKRVLTLQKDGRL